MPRLISGFESQRRRTFFSDNQCFNFRVYKSYERYKRYKRCKSLSDETLQGDKRGKNHGSDGDFTEPDG